MGITPFLLDRREGREADLCCISHELQQSAVCYRSSNPPERKSFTQTELLKPIHVIIRSQRHSGLFPSLFLAQNIGERNMPLSLPKALHSKITASSMRRQRSELIRCLTRYSVLSKVTAALAPPVFGEDLGFKAHSSKLGLCLKSPHRL